MITVGLTGGIGSGKSTVAALFAAKGIPIIDTDVLARELTAIDTPALTKIVATFGSAVLLTDHSLDRKKLRQLIFADVNKRKQLEQILHPLIRAEIKSRLPFVTTPYCIVVIPLLFETEPNSLIQRTLLVDAPLELQITRVQARDEVSFSEITAILQTQLTREQRLKLADDVILNDGAYNALIPQINKLHEFYLTLSKR